MSNIFGTERGEACFEGLKIGVRRGNLNLVKTCFDDIYATDSRVLLPDVLAHLCIEECWYAYGEFIQWPVESKKDLLKACYRLALAPKSKDAFALPTLQKLSDSILNSVELGKIIDVELTSAQGYIQWVRKSGLFVAPVEQLRQRLFDEIQPTGFLPLNDYKREAVSHILCGIGSGGVMLSHFRSIAAMVLFGRRAFTEDKIKAKLKDCKVANLASGVKPETIELPWYCYTNNTEIGRMALEKTSSHRLIKRAGLALKDVVGMYSALETRRTPKRDLSCIKREPSTVAQPWDNVWWVDYIKLKLPRDMPSREGLKFYRDVVAPLIQENVEAILRKRV